MSHQALKQLIRDWKRSPPLAKRRRRQSWLYRHGCWTCGQTLTSFLREIDLPNAVCSQMIEALLEANSCRLRSTR